MSDSFIKKLYNYAPQPPENTWEGIESALNETPLFAQKLHSYQPQPPANAWEKIAASMQVDLKKNIVVPFSRNTNWMRYAAAAAVIIFIAGGIYFSLFQNKIATPVSAATNTIAPLPENNIATKTTEQNLGNNERNTSEGKPVAAMLAAANLKSYGRTSKPNANRAAIDESDKQIHFTNDFIPAYAENEKRFAVNANTEKYMVYSDGDGNAMRLSRRLFDLVACIKSEIECKERIEILQQKMAATTMTTDFTGLVAMLSNLKEN